VLFPSTNFTKFGLDTTITTPTIAPQTLGADQRIRFKVAVVSGTSISIAYNGPNPGASDSRATVAIPEFHEVAIPIGFTVLMIPVMRRWRSKRDTAKLLEPAENRIEMSLGSNSACHGQALLTRRPGPCRGIVGRRVVPLSRSAPNAGLSRRER